MITIFHGAAGFGTPTNGSAAENTAFDRRLAVRHRITVGAASTPQLGARTGLTNRGFGTKSIGIACFECTCSAGRFFADLTGITALINRRNEHLGRPRNLVV
jgi:hypothetical protein